MILLLLFAVFMIGLSVYLIRKGYQMEKQEYVYIEEDYKDGMTCDDCSCENKEIYLEGIDKPIPKKKLQEWR